MIQKMNEMVKRFDLWDIGLIKGTLLFVGIIAAKLFPGLLHIRYSVLAVIVIVLAARPAWRYFMSK